ncbi:phosphoenolpyruvate hydrolase family protein [Chelativorans sp. YIM 93263]|uniref:phosphoenolpyruvate hydrolase family protein n=1 Tax=Chelativorans sp. YIM 93263 TaxID=2906648 RepID=UPI002379465A|nr:phosphoenolpyruvate hydrolase family protein [Chelativorans sp. YIM 93263]
MTKELQRQSVSADAFRALSHAQKKGAHDQRFLIGAAIGAGMIARAAENGGADFLLALNAGRIRVMGAASIACHLAIHDANRFVLAFARAEILDRVKVPVIFGASVFDPQLDLDRLLDTIAEAGFAGVTNFPSSIHLDRRLRDALAVHGLGYAREIELVEKARKRGLATVAYGRERDHATAMVDAGTDVFCYNFGWNAGGWSNLPSLIGLDEAGEEAYALFERLRSRRKDVLCVVEGGPIESAEDAAHVCKIARADGYIGGSTIDRLPLEAAVSDAASAYKSISDLNAKIETLQDKMLGDGRRFGLIGRSAALTDVVHRIERFADVDLTVLVLGANGTGKELVAQALHDTGPRRNGPLVPVNCAAIPRDLLESELFGYEKGAFTGAHQSRAGRFEEAQGGTLFLDEIGDLEPQLQAKLLRVLETGSFHRLGSSAARHTDARIVCATNRDLKAMVEEGTFRADLYYRLNRIEIEVPPLSARMEDLPLLVQHFLETSIRRIRPDVRNIDGDALRALMGYAWPGNVRELRNVLERAAILCEGERITRRDLPRLEQPVEYPSRPVGTDLPEGARTIANEREWILDGLRRNRFRRGDTARWLGISRKTLYNKMKDYALD